MNIGKLVLTTGVWARMQEDEKFVKALNEALKRYRVYDWGNCCKEDWELNDHAVQTGLRTLGAYTIDPELGESKGYGENTLWIITEADRSYTTILFPSEY